MEKVANYSDCRTALKGTEYNNLFKRNCRNRFKAEDTNLFKDYSGGYYLPDVFDEKLEAVMSRENIMRQLCKAFKSSAIKTSTAAKIFISMTKPASAWRDAGESISINTEIFNRLTVNAFKLSVAVSFSNSFLLDESIDLEAYLTEAFGKELAAKEEEAFLTGSGLKQPLGILQTISAEQDRYIISENSATISASDLIKVQKALPRTYRRNATWLVSDSCLEQIRNLRDSAQNLLWQPGLSGTEPPSLLGARVFTSPFLPEPASNQIVALYGDFSHYRIIQRAHRTIIPIEEMLALNDLSAFIVTEYIDGILLDTSAVKGIRLK